MLPVLGLHPVHHELVQPVGQVGVHEEGPAVAGVHGLVHERVGAGKVQHLVGEVLGGAILPPGLVGGLAGTLRGQEGTSSAQPPQRPSLLPPPSPLRTGLGPSLPSSLESIFSTPLPDLGKPPADLSRR